MVGAQSIYIDSMSSLSLSALITQEIDPTIKIWPSGGKDKEPAKHTILFDMEIACTPQPSVPTVNRISSAVLRGVSHEGRLISRDACNQEQEGNIDTRVRQVRPISAM